MIDWHCPNCSFRMNLDPRIGPTFQCPNCQATVTAETVPIPMAESVEPPAPAAPIAETSAWAAVEKADPCPRCREPVPPPRAQARMTRKARLMLLACIPLNLVWFIGAGAILLFVPAPVLPGGLRGAQAYLVLVLLVVAIFFAPTLFLAWRAWSQPRVVTVRCRGCGWSEERIQQPK